LVWWVVLRIHSHLRPLQSLKGFLFIRFMLVKVPVDGWHYRGSPWSGKSQHPRHYLTRKVGRDAGYAKPRLPQVLVLRGRVKIVPQLVDTIAGEDAEDLPLVVRKL
jgi:hypothetical protein